MADVIVDVILPSAITTDVTSPSYSANTNVFIPGADGPQGPIGPIGPSGSSDLFKIIKVTGQADLIPSGAETLQFIAGTGISIITNSNLNPYKSIKIDASPLSGYLQSEVNSLNATITGNYVTKFNGQFTNRPTVNGTGVLLSGELARLPDTILYTTGNQIKSGRLIIGDDAISIVDPNSQYTLSLQTNSPRTWLEILNNSGSNKGVFFGIEGNDFEQWNYQAGDIKFFTSENVSDGYARLTIKNDGKVGIGTSSPSEKLEVAGNIKANNLIYTTGNQIKSGRLIIGDTILDSSYPYTLSLQSNDALTLLEILNNGGSGQGAQVCMNGNEFELYNNQGGDIIFYTAENPSGGIDRLYIKNNGNIGIGTNIPSEKLELVGNLKVSNSGFFNSGIQVGTGVYVEPQRILINGDPVITRSSLNAVSGYFEKENVIGYKANLTAGSDNYYIQYPTVLNTAPRSVVCAFQNIVDDMAYYFNIGNINSTGFYINFSDTLLNNGYYLNIQVKK